MPRRSLCSQELSKLPPTARSGRLALTLLIALLTATTAGAQETISGNWADYKAASLTESDDHETIYISTAEELALFAYNVNNDVQNAKGYYCARTVELLADIDLSAHYWTPIGFGKGSYYFNGKFNGNGHVITGMNVQQNSNNVFYGFVGNFEGQSAGTGTLNINGTDCHGIITNGDVVINGGTVNAILTINNYGGQNAISATNGGNVTINGGNVTANATGGYDGIKGSNVAINGGTGNGARQLTMVFEESPTSVSPSLSPTIEGGSQGWYSLDGRQLSGKPTAKGVYIHHGRKEVIK